MPVLLLHGTKDNRLVCNVRKFQTLNFWDFLFAEHLILDLYNSSCEATMQSFPSSHPTRGGPRGTCQSGRTGHRRADPNEAHPWVLGGRRVCSQAGSGVQPSCLKLPWKFTSEFPCIRKWQPVTASPPDSKWCQQGAGHRSSMEWSGEGGVWACVWWAAGDLLWYRSGAARKYHNNASKWVKLYSKHTVLTPRRQIYFHYKIQEQLTEFPV